MAANPIGLIAAVTAFISIWIGHIAVRKIESISERLWLPMLVFGVLGITLEIAALLFHNRPLSMVCGIIGITLLWDVFELNRQASRVRMGHAPANMHNPRHTAMQANGVLLASAPAKSKIHMDGSNPLGGEQLR